MFWYATPTAALRFFENKAPAWQMTVRLAMAVM
jgi:hypothetical protein